KELLASGLFEISRFFVTASTSENQPMTIIEACMFGLPLIGVNAKGVPEMIKENGFIAEPGDTEKIAEYMEKILNNDELQAEMSKKSRVIGKKYDIKRTTDSMLKLYTKLGQDKS
ncbi:MAG: glycosyltransferase, partial [Vulcanimicrobiota bacterium]